MSFGTARARLDRDILFLLVCAAGHKCYRCNEALTRNNFSVDHKEIWATADDPVKAYFDLGNIAFSHHTCNAAVTSNSKYETEEERRVAKAEQAKVWRAKRSKELRIKRRRDQYLRTGK